MKNLNKNLIIITGPSGAGKTSVARGVLKKMSRVKKLITCTTRKKRRLEESGKDYKFVTKPEFKKFIKEKKLLEWAEVYGEYYGSLSEDLFRLLKKYDKVLMVIDVQGAKTISKKLHFAKLVFIKPSDLANLEKRIKRRGKVSEEDLKKRLTAIKQEIGYARECDYVILNKEGKLDEAIQKAVKIVEKL